MSIYRDLLNSIFTDYKINIDQNPTENHVMTIEHEEILGQFLDYTGIDPEGLKEILVKWYVNMWNTKEIIIWIIIKLALWIT